VTLELCGPQLRYRTGASHCRLQKTLATVGFLQPQKCRKDSDHQMSHGFNTIPSICFKKESCEETALQKWMKETWLQITFGIIGTSKIFGFPMISNHKTYKKDEISLHIRYRLVMTHSSPWKDPPCYKNGKPSNFRLGPWLPWQGNSHNQRDTDPHLPTLPVHLPAPETKRRFKKPWLHRSRRRTIGPWEYHGNPLKTMGYKTWW